MVVRLIWGEMMKNLSRIRAVIEVLELYAKGGITEIYLGNGQFMQVNFVLKEPAASEEIHLFKQETGWELPEDLEEFLIHHNGARLFNDPEHHGGPEIFSLDDIKLYQDGYMPESEKVYPIVYIRGGFVCVDSELVKNGQENYLLWKDIVSPIEEAQHMNENFTLWLDRFLISQGSELLAVATV
jgi:hypothetical protein